MTKDVTQELMPNITDQTEKFIKEAVSDTVARVLEEGLAEALSKALLDSEFYRKLSDELREGLGIIYREITQTEQMGVELPELTKEEAEEIFHETSDQLDAVLKTTEKATVEIMAIVEKHLEQSTHIITVLEKIKKEKHDATQVIDWLIAKNNELNKDLLKIMTSLSFQDLTGQRIKKIISSLRKIEEHVLKLYLTAGLSIKTKEKEPDKDFETIKAETEKTVSELKGPQAGVSQADVDELLAQLGL
ncbi:protein phosphatase CheZ [Desulfohalobiaceae bacterium Ax17]|uniref:protein phosphatase CheZ n=1 Tax=Desulfovulcanus ferrireducens TaxID=2831190 RepID=UPI00207BC54C|nr:protein phosphatase CheZ [Desulfovulcanus ferrireducens]MBT8764048.1 protein phosphatase CheZ [Desulfovulcanus ferrireducens]